MALQNKLGLTDEVALARAEEKLSKQKALALYDTGLLDTFPVGTFAGLAKIHAYLFGEIYDFAGQLRTVNIAKGNMPYIMLDEADVIVCGAIGKDISGAGFDPNILGRSSVLKQFVLHIPRYQRLVLCDVTPASHGNGIGVGLFDVITKKVADQLDLASMYANAIACNCLGDANIPCTVEDEATAIRVALKCCRGIDRDDPKIIRIQNTLHLKYIQVSRALLPDVEADPRLTLVDGPED